MQKKETPKPKQKKYYTVEVECLIPAIVRYKLLVDEDEFDLAATESVKSVPMAPPRFQLSKMKRISAKVYEYGTNMIKHIHKF